MAPGSVMGVRYIMGAQLILCYSIGLIASPVIASYLTPVEEIGVHSRRHRRIHRGFRGLDIVLRLPEKVRRQRADRSLAKESLAGRNAEDKRNYQYRISFHIIRVFLFH